jgi:FkbM family methyltransferase
MNNSVTKFYSQSGEDEILFEIFQDKQQGLCVEVCGFNGVDASNSYFFEKLGWRCIVVEPIPELCEKIRSKRKCRLFNCAAGDYNGETKFYVHEQDPIVSSLNFTKVQLDYQKYNRQTLREIPVEMKTLDSILEEENVKEKEIDFISIDVEGYEINVLRGFSLQKYLPRILIIEDNSKMTDDRVRKFMSQFGYVLFKRTGVNDWYAKETDSIVDQDEVSKLKIKL